MKSRRRKVRTVIVCKQNKCAYEKNKQRKFPLISFSLSNLYSHSVFYFCLCNSYRKGMPSSLAEWNGTFPWKMHSLKTVLKVPAHICFLLPFAAPLLACICQGGCRIEASLAEYLLLLPLCVTLAVRFLRNLQPPGWHFSDL